MYRLGVSYIDNSGSRDTDAYLRNSFLNPATPIVQRHSGSHDVAGGSIFDPASYSSLFEDGRDETYSYGVSSCDSVLTIKNSQTPPTPLSPKNG